jgi:transposase
VPALATSIAKSLDESSSVHDRLRRLEEEKLHLATRNAELSQQNAALIERNTLLTEEVHWLKSQVFGRSSEKSSADVSPDQRMLFNEAEVLAAIAAADEKAGTQSVAAHERKAKPGRKAIPDKFPRKQVMHDVPESEKVCPMDGTPRVRIGEEISEQYEYTPPKLIVLQHVRPKYASGCDHHDGIKIAPVPLQLMPKSMASPSLLAHITTAKFDDGLPLTRQSKQFERLGLDIGASTMGVWMNTIGGEKVVPIINLLNETLLEEPYIHLDETPVQVLKSAKAPSTDHYMWVRAAGAPGRRMILFDYVPTRNTETLKTLLTGPDGPYRGKIISDGLQLYDGLAEAWKLLHFGCLSHCRRYFVTAEKVGQSPTGRTLARVVIRDFIGALYGVERHIKALRERREQAGHMFSLDEVLQIRQEKGVPIAEAFKKWLDDVGPGVTPTSALGKAIAYSLSQWPKLVRYLEHPEIGPDNNRVEQAIRPFAVGRNSWMFCDTQGGARASANLYSLVLSARANGIEPLEYLTHIYTQIPAATTVEQFEALLPWNVKETLKQSTAAQPSITPTTVHQTGRPKATTRLIETIIAD